MRPPTPSHDRRQRNRRLRRNSLLLGLIPLIPVCLALSACSTHSGSDAKTLRIYAASSLTESFNALAEAFERTHPQTEVLLNFAGSQTLRMQIQQGAPADLFASANAEHLEVLVASDHIGQWQTLAENALVVIVPRGHSGRIQAFEDLPRAQRLIVGTAQSPIGRYTQALLSQASDALGAEFRDQVLTQVVSREHNTRLVQAKVAMGEADAAIVYKTDALASDQVHMIPIPEAYQPRAEYRIGTIQGCDASKLAQTWMRFVSSAEGRTVLTQHGFIAPTVPPPSMPLRTATR